MHSFLHHVSILLLALFQVMNSCEESDIHFLRCPVVDIMSEFFHSEWHYFNYFGSPFGLVSTMQVHSNFLCVYMNIYLSLSRIFTFWPSEARSSCWSSWLIHQISASFNASIQCDNKLADVTFSGHFASDNDLQDMCTSKCLTTLGKYQTQQKKACLSSDTVVADGITYPATHTVDQLIFTYNYTCKRDP